MKSGYLKRVGKIGRRNLEANKRLKELYEEKDIRQCELRFHGCMVNNYLTFAHKKKRVEYLSNPDGLSDFNETILACVHCHDKIEVSRKLTQSMFEILRPNGFSNQEKSESDER